MEKAIGGAQDAVRMQRVVSFYEKLPRGPAPAPQPKGLIERYQARYFGKNPSGMRKISHWTSPMKKLCSDPQQPSSTSLAV